MLPGAVLSSPDRAREPPAVFVLDGWPFRALHGDKSSTYFSNQPESSHYPPDRYLFDLQQAASHALIFADIMLSIEHVAGAPRAVGKDRNSGRRPPTR